MSAQLTLQQQLDLFVQNNPVLSALLAAAGAAAVVRYHDRHYRSKEDENER